MSNDYYNQTGWPATGSSGASANARSELADIAAGFDKLPGLSGNANKIVGVNAAGDGLEAKSITFAGAFATVGAYAVTFTFTGVTGVTFPTAGTLATLAGTETLTNKTISGANNTMTNIGNSSLTNSSLTVNGTAISLGGSGTVTAAAGTLTGATLASNVVNASINAITPSGGTLAITGSGSVTGNVIITTAGNGIDFSATSGAGTSELLNDYEEGTFTPTAAVSLSLATGKYTKVGRAVHFVIEVTFPVTASTASAALQSLPFTASAENFACAVWTNRGTAIFAYVQASSTDIGLYNVSTGGIYDYVDFSADSLKISGTYFV